MLLSLVTDLMQGKSPVVAFTSLPRKMLGDLEDPLVGTEELPLNWSSDREQVCGERERERERERDFVFQDLPSFFRQFKK